MREVRMWVLDVNSPEFLAKLAKDMKITSAQDDEQDVMEFIDAVSTDLWD